jgi:anti-sigma factor (TIGR02949 family)
MAMSVCEECRERLPLYLEKELTNQEMKELRAHLADCAACREELEEEQILTRVLRRPRPLYAASDELRSRVTAALDAAPPEATQARGFGRLVLSSSRRAAKWFTWRTVVGAAVVVALCIWFVPYIALQVRAANYVEAAVAVHRGLESGNVPLGIQSSMPAVVSAWVAGRVQFHFQLPASDLTPKDEAMYRLSGASVVNYKGKEIALVVYQMKNRKISLLVAPSDSAVTEGGEEVRFGGITFHYRSTDHFQVITWSNHRVAYALVSPLGSGSAQESCLVCHQDMADHGSFGQKN